MPLPHSPHTSATSAFLKTTIMSAPPAEQEATANVNAVKLPAFWPQKPRSWFIPVEAQFRRAGITQETTKFDHVLAVLDPETCDRISDVAENPGDTPYTTLKERLLKSFSLSPWQAMWQLFDYPEMAGDQQPSQFLASMKALLPPEEKADSFYFKALFIKKLPDELRGPLIGSKFETIAAMAAHADTLWGARSVKPAIHAVQDTDRRGRSPGRRDKQRRRADTPSNNKLCFYHTKFGKEARRCDAPCRYQPSGNALAADDSD